MRFSALSLKKHYILASLVKGEVLSPEKIRATTGGIATPLSLACTNPPEPALSHPLFVGAWACPSRCTEYCHPHTHCKRTIIPRPAPPPLPPLSKGGGLTARHKLSLCCVLLAIHLPFLFTKLFAVKTEGLLATNCFSPVVTFVNNPSVTVTENTILCQRIFNFYKKQY